MSLIDKKGNVDIFLNNIIIKLYLSRFYDNTLSKIKPNQIVFITLKMQYEPGNYVTLGKLQKITNNETEFNSLLEYYYGILSIKNDEYKTIPIVKFIIGYKILSINKSTKYLNKYNEGIDLKANKPANYINKFSGFDLPNNIDYKT